MWLPDPTPQNNFTPKNPVRTPSPTCLTCWPFKNHARNGHLKHQVLWLVASVLVFYGLLKVPSLPVAVNAWRKRNSK